MIDRSGLKAPRRSHGGSWGILPFLLLAGWLSGSAHAAQAPSVAAGRITTVTVMPAGAWVTRVLPVDGQPAEMAQAPHSSVPAGTVVITGLPSDLDRQSLRFGGDVQQISPIRVIARPASERPAVQALDHRIDRLQQQRATARDRQVAASTRLAILRTQMSGIRGKEIGAFMSDPAARQRFDRMLDHILADRRKAREQQHQIEQQLVAAQQQRAALIKQGGDLSVQVVLSIGKDSKRPPTLSYRVHNAGWQPVYSARLATKTGLIDWQMAAEVHQETGEDWSRVRLTLVTLDNRRYYPAPSLPRWTVAFRDKTVRPLSAATASGRMKTMQASADQQGQWARDSHFNAHFQVARAVTLDSQKEPVEVAVGHDRLPADIAVRVAPQRMPLAVLTASFSLKSTEPLPAGRLVLFRDGTQVGGRSIQALAPGQKLVLGFGVDRAVSVDYRPHVDQRDEHGLIGKSRQLVRKASVIVTNRHDRKVPVTVLMHMPVAVDADIAVEPLPSNTPPTTHRFDDTDGVWAWSRDLAAGKSMTVKFGFRLRWPEDKQLSGI